MKRPHLFIASCVMFLFLGTSIPVCAQIQTESEEIISRRQSHIIKMLNDYIDYIADSTEKYEDRKYYVNRALKLFINEGDEYEIFDGSVIKKISGSIVEIRSKYGKRNVRRRIKEYLRGLLNLRYKPASITEATFAVVYKENVIKVANNKYIATCFVDNAFCGIRDGLPMYKDITRKTIKIPVNIEDFEDFPLVFIVDVGVTTVL